MAEDAAASSPEACANDIDSVSAFFIDTMARMDKAPYFQSNMITGGIKTAFLLLTICLVYFVLYRHAGAAKRADSLRKWLVMVFSIVFVARILLQMLVFWHRRITWNEVFAEAGFIIPLSLGSLALGCVYRGRISPQLTVLDWLGVVLFCWGTYLNVGSELQRHLWKMEPDNAGRLFTMQLWRHARHINYFGEIVSFVGFALMCQLWNLWIPVTMGLGMALFSVPELDFYLAKRYGTDWEAYTQEVQYNMIPLVW